MAVSVPPNNYWYWFPIETFVGDINGAWVDGLVPTSWWRSWEENVRVGGSSSPLSQHLAGLAVDLAGTRAQLDRFEDLARTPYGAKFITVRYANHVHAQYGDRGWLDRWVENPRQIQT